jgi:DNA-binding transcriptional regulator YhcF (GntR family)
MSIKSTIFEPGYLQIVHHIKVQIINGVYNPGETLPSRRKLASLFNVNLNTVQKALAELEKQNIIATDNNKPSYIKISHSQIKKMRSELIQTALDKFFYKLELLNINYEEAVILIENSLKTISK